MNNLQAFGFDENLWVAARDEAEALEVLASTGYIPSHYSAPALPNEHDLDEHRVCVDFLPAPTLRQRLAHSKMPGLLVDNEGTSPAVPSALWTPPSGWVRCSAELIAAGVDCCSAPRWSNGSPGPHWHPAPRGVHLPLTEAVEAGRLNAVNWEPITDAQRELIKTLDYDYYHVGFEPGRDNCQESIAYFERAIDRWGQTNDPMNFRANRLAAFKSLRPASQTGEA